MASKTFQYSGDWHVRAPDGAVVNLNSSGGAEMVLGLWEEIARLDAQLHKRRKRRRPKAEEDVLRQL